MPNFHVKHPKYQDPRVLEKLKILWCYKVYAGISLCFYLLAISVKVQIDKERL